MVAPHDELENKALTLITRLKRRQVEGSYFAARETLLFLREVISRSKWSTAADVMTLVKDFGSRIENALPSETAIGNIVRRVLFIIREEYGDDKIDSTVANNQSQSLQHFVHRDDEGDDYGQYKQHLKTKVIESVNELTDELATSRKDIGTYASDLIHAKEIILTVGYSFTAEEFFMAAARSDINNFQVIVVEGGPRYKGQQMALHLASAGVETTVIADSAVFAIMSRVNKVIIGAHAIMADGGLMASSGTHTIAQAASYFSTPVIVCAAIYKLTPQYPTYNQDEFNDLISPNETLPYSEAGVLDSEQVITPLYDYVPPNLIELFITNYGGYAPSYIYRQLREYYHPDDITV